MQAFDSNILAYAAGLRQADADERKVAFATQFVREILSRNDVVVAAQALAELHNMLRRKGGHSSAEARQVVREYAATAHVVPTDTEVLSAAFNLAAAHHLQTYDAIILAAAARAGCDILYSEDMQDGFEWSGVMVVNPFA